MTESKVTLAEMDQLVIDIFNQKKKIEEMEGLVSDENKKLSALEAKAVLYMEELGRDSFKSPAGNVSIVEKWRFSLPKTPEDKEAFFTYLKNRGVFDSLITVNSNTYNSFIQKEWEAAKEAGHGLDFQLPGVPQPTLYKQLSKRKA